MKKISVKLVNIYSNTILDFKLLKIKFKIIFPTKILMRKFIICKIFLILNLNIGKQSKIMWYVIFNQFLIFIVLKF